MTPKLHSLLLGVLCVSVVQPLQFHGDQDHLVRFRKVEIKEITQE